MMDAANPQTSPQGLTSLTRKSSFTCAIYIHEYFNRCKRHDFGYHNYKKQHRFTEANRKRIDDNFKKDLYNECAKYSGIFDSWKGVACRKIANTYYDAVRTFGGL